MSHFPVVAPLSLSVFQHQFADYLRQPASEQLAQRYHIPERVGQIYRELVFNNVSGFIHQCFPICQQLVSEHDWQRLIRQFFQHYPLTTPYFSEINACFVDFIQHYTQFVADDNVKFPDYFAELAHYEWIELDIETAPACPMLTKRYAYEMMQLNDSLQLLHYQWAVHRIDKTSQPQQPEDTFLAMFRHVKSHQVECIQLNALSYVLLEFMQNSETYYPTIEALITAFALDLGYSEIEQLLPFAKDLLTHLHIQGLIL